MPVKKGKQNTNRDGSRSYSTTVGTFWSVTTILGIIDKSAPLMYWATKCAAIFVEEEIRKLREKKLPLTMSIVHDICERSRKEFRNVKTDAADVGTKVHELVEKWCKAKIAKQPFETPELLDPRIKNSFELFLQWAEEVKLNPLYTELFTYHPIHEYAGTTDIVAEGMFNKKWKKPRTYLLDIKTSNHVYASYEMQDAAYSEAFRIDAKVVVDGEGIIRIGKEDGKPEFVDCSERHLLNFQRFLAAKELYILMNGRPK